MADNRDANDIQLPALPRRGQIELVMALISRNPFFAGHDTLIPTAFSGSGGTPYFRAGRMLDGVLGKNLCRSHPPPRRNPCTDLSADVSTYVIAEITTHLIDDLGTGSRMTITKR